MGLFGWLGKRKTKAIPGELWEHTIAELPFLAALSQDERQALKNLAERFLADKEFTAAAGLELDDEICVAIAAQACLPILELGLTAYGDWVGIIVYPDQFVVPRQLADDSGVVHEYDDVLAGESWPGGPVVISWHDARMAGDGYNVVIHEFAHKLDMLNGEADGVPALHSGLTAEEWENVFFRAYDDFCRRVDSGEETLIDPYASEHPAEFFAVLSESFFEQPAVVDGDYPGLYQLLKRYYRQDPLARIGRSARSGTGN
ncbi:MAG: zinc-dependent peptidase [Bacteroidota bacterium]